MVADKGEFAISCTEGHGSLYSRCTTSDGDAVECDLTVTNVHCTGVEGVYTADTGTAATGNDGVSYTSISNDDTSKLRWYNESSSAGIGSDADEYSTAYKGMVGS